MDHRIFILNLACFGVFVTDVYAQYGASAGGGYGGGGGGGGAGYGTGNAAAYPSYGTGGGGYGGSGSYGSSYASNQGTGVYFKKPVPIDEKPIFFRTPYWLPNMYYGHYGYPWTEWFDGGPRYVVPIMNAYPHGGGSTQQYGAGYNLGSNGGVSYSGGTPANGTAAGGYGYGTAADDTGGTTTADPFNDGFSYYKGIPMYQTYYEKYLLQKAQAAAAAATTAAPAA